MSFSCKCRNRSCFLLNLFFSPLRQVRRKTLQVPPLGAFERWHLAGFVALTGSCGDSNSRSRTTRGLLPKVVPEPVGSILLADFHSADRKHGSPSWGILF